MSNRLQKLRDKWSGDRLMSLRGVPRTASPDTVFNLALAADPTPNHKYLDWTLVAWESGKFLFEDIQAGADSKVADQLLRFDANKHKISDPAMRSLMKYKGPGELDAAMDAAGVSMTPDFFELSSNQQKKMLMAKARLESIHHETESGLKLDTPLTKFASQILGRQTRWCTAADKDNQFLSYSSLGPLLIIELPDKQRFQMHYHGTHVTEQELKRFTILNEKDSGLTPKQWEELSPYIPEIVEYIVPRLLEKVQEHDAHISERLSLMVAKEFKSEMNKMQEDYSAPPIWNMSDYERWKGTMGEYGVEVGDWDESKKELSSPIKGKDLINLPNILVDLRYKFYSNQNNIIIDYSKSIAIEDVYNSYADAWIKQRYAMSVWDNTIRIHGKPINKNDLLNVTLVLIQKYNDVEEEDMSVYDIESAIRIIYHQLDETHKYKLLDMLKSDTNSLKGNSLLSLLMSPLVYKKASSLKEAQSLMGVFNKTSIPNSDLDNIIDILKIGATHHMSNPGLENDIENEIRKNFGHYYQMLSIFYVGSSVHIEELTELDKEFVVQSLMSIQQSREKLLRVSLEILTQDEPSRIHEKVLECVLEHTDKSQFMLDEISNMDENKVSDIRETGILDILGHDEKRSHNWRVFDYLSEKERSIHMPVVIASSLYKDMDPETSDNIRVKPYTHIETGISLEKERCARLEATQSRFQALRYETCRYIVGQKIKGLKGYLDSLESMVKGPALTGERAPPLN